MNYAVIYLVIPVDIVATSNELHNSIRRFA